MLPEPNVSATLAKNSNLRVALDLTEEWNKVAGVEPVQGCIVVRKDYFEENETAVRLFLKEYNAAVNYTNANHAETAALMEQYGILAPLQLRSRRLKSATSSAIAMSRCAPLQKPCSRCFMMQTRRAWAAQCRATTSTTAKQKNKKTICRGGFAAPFFTGGPMKRILKKLLDCRVLAFAVAAWRHGGWKPGAPAFPMGNGEGICCACGHGLFWKTAGATLLRVAAGFLLGMAAGAALGILTAFSRLADDFLAPFAAS